MTKGARRTRAPRYEERLVLFVDFLGFKAAVSRTASGEARLADLIDALNAVGAIGENDEDLSSQMVTQFSDSVVVSYTVDEESAVFRLLNSIAICVLDLVERGFLLRGAVTRGLLLHDEDHVVGPALVKAYEMESRQAIQPRIIVDPEILAVAREARAEQHDADEEEGYVRAHLSEGADGLLWIDYIRWKAVVAVIGGDNDLYPGYLRTIGAMVAAGLGQDEAGVLSKHLWLRERYLEAIDDFAPANVGEAYVAESPEVVADIRALPRFEAEAARARGIVAAHPVAPTGQVVEAGDG